MRQLMLRPRVLIREAPDLERYSDACKKFVQAARTLGIVIALRFGYREHYDECIDLLDSALAVG
ncbi:hypothetical protein [Burkholderia sp. Bp9031]|uniref:hypothetical protein n=1 Tax=Burkholderia sp. Bp9031 TaxID=2184566 RepID=UPI00163B1992|nr:hypothetical protein [Burkholderia sp. Bp9031]